ncbi:unnamed protein product [Closterium sp. Naga37s-1]|nr:unnamed protein product [Closterium sp. Naga37s-1]
MISFDPRHRAMKAFELLGLGAQDTVQYARVGEVGGDGAGDNDHDLDPLDHDSHNHAGGGARGSPPLGASARGSPPPRKQQQQQRVPGMVFKTEAARAAAAALDEEMAGGGERGGEGGRGGGGGGNGVGEVRRPRQAAAAPLCSVSHPPVSGCSRPPVSGCSSLSRSPSHSLRWVDRWMGGWVGGRVDGWMGGRVDGWEGGWVGGWEGGWVGGWMGGRVGGRVGGWVGGPVQTTLAPGLQVFQPSTRAQTTESVASLEHSVYDESGVFQVTFDTLEEEIREIKDQLNGNQTGAKPAAPIPPVVQLAKLRVQVEELSSQQALLRGKLDSLVAAAGGGSAAVAAAPAGAEGSGAGINSTGGVAVQQAVGKLLEPLKARVQRDEERLRAVQERVDVVEKELADSMEVLQQLQVEVVTGGKDPAAASIAAASVAAADIPATTAALATPNVPAATVIPASDELAAVVIPEPTEPAAVVVPPPKKPAAVAASNEPTAVIIPDASEPAAVVIPEPTEPAAVVVPEATVPAAVVFPAPKEPGAGAVAVPEAGEPAAVVVPSPIEPAAVVVPEPADPAAVVVPGPSDSTPGPAAAAAAGAMGGMGGGKEGEAEGEEEEEDDADLGPPEDYPGEGDVGEEGEEGGEEEGEEEGGEGEAGTAEQVGKKSAGTAGETEAGGEEEAEEEGEGEVGEEGEEEGEEVGEDESPAVGGIDVAEVQQCGDEVLDLPAQAKAWKQRSLVQVTPELQLFSAYRYNPHTIALVGLLAPAVPTLPLDACLFRQLDGSQPIAGSLLRLQVETTAAVVLRFEGDTVLPPCGGYLECTAAAAGGAKVVVYTEGRGELSTPPSPLPTPLTICSLLITNGVWPPRLREWLDYHRVAAGAATFVLYRHSKSHWPTELRQAVGEYERMGMAEVTDIVGADKEQEKMLALQDCLYRTSFSSAWTLPLDLDEYLSASPPATLPSLLSASSLAASPYLSLGAVRWSTEVCLGEADVVKVETEGIGGDAGEEDDAAADSGRGNSSSGGAVFAVERAVFREAAPVCNAEATGGGGEVDAALCEGDAGTRRVIVNPRKVALLSLHHPIPPKGGATLNAHTQARVNRFPGLSSVKQAGQVCSSEVPQSGDAAAAAVDAAAAGAPRGSVESLEVAEGAKLAREWRLCSIEVPQSGDAAAAAVDAAALGAPRGSVESLEVAEGAKLARECPIEKNREVSLTGKRGGEEEVGQGRASRECPIEGRVGVSYRERKNEAWDKEGRGEEMEGVGDYET